MLRLGLLYLNQNKFREIEKLQIGTEKAIENNDLHYYLIDKKRNYSSELKEIYKEF
jgi:hypothetical protein